MIGNKREKKLHFLLKWTKRDQTDGHWVVNECLFSVGQSVDFHRGLTHLGRDREPVFKSKWFARKVIDCAIICTLMYYFQNDIIWNSKVDCNRFSLETRFMNLLHLFLLNQHDLVLKNKKEVFTLNNTWLGNRIEFGTTSLLKDRKDTALKMRLKTLISPSGG